MVRGIPRSSSSGRVRHANSRLSEKTGKKVFFTEVFRPVGIEARKNSKAVEMRQKIRARNARRTELRAQSAQGDDDFVMFEAAMDGSVRVELSNAGGEFHEVAQGIGADSMSKRPAKRHYHKGGRTRRDRPQIRTTAFEKQLPEIVDAYMGWSAEQQQSYAPREDDHQPGVVDDVYPVRVVDVYTTTKKDVPSITTDAWTASAFVRQGLVPCAVQRPSVVITIQALELFRLSNLCCPHMAVEPFVKMLCDLQSRAFKPYLAKQFGIAFDLYQAIRRAVEARVKAVLRRDTPNWRIRHECPACTHELVGEPELLYKRLITMDGNDSLKRIERRVLGMETEVNEAGVPVPAPSSERCISTFLGEDYILPRAVVDAWASDPAEGNDVAQDDTEVTPCESRWTNMNEAATAKAWGIFEETGIFTSLCRHGFVLVAADIVRSGELSKYPLAVEDHLIRTLGQGLLNGYDIACQHASTVNKSALGPLARENGFQCIVGAFHGHAHNRLCQLSYLPNYRKGVGLEDFEGNERHYSKTNHYAPSLRSASPFHRHQSIVGYYKHLNSIETYQALTPFLLNNYVQAGDIIALEPQLWGYMAQLGITDPMDFDDWLVQERAYLTGLQKEPLEETTQMEYVSKLQDLAEKNLQITMSAEVWVNENKTQRSHTATRKVETARRHALERRDRVEETVRELEMRLEVEERWTAESQEYVEAHKLLINRHYQRALDNLEGLVVSRIFELTKMNRSQTGYKMRKHISKALQTRSKAVKTALEAYNKAAAALNPPRQSLLWDEVIEYAFLADFDLLRDTRRDVRENAWATPIGRFAMDLHFRIRRAKEEIERLNVEIPRLVTYLRDETEFLQAKEAEIRASDPLLAHQVSLYRAQRSRFDDFHYKNLATIKALPHFSGTIAPRMSVEKWRAQVASVASQAATVAASLGLDGEGKRDDTITENFGPMAADASVAMLVEHMQSTRGNAATEVDDTPEDLDDDDEAAKDQDILDACDALFNICLISDS